MFRLLYLFLFFREVYSITIDSKLGILKGSEFTAKDGSLVHAFKRVPFAQPPVGDLRYALPQPATSWTGVLDATKYGPACMSNSTTSTSIQKWVEEDCLHVNIFVSDRCLKSTKKCPIVFYVHGGGFNYDSAVMFPDEPLVNNFGAQDVVLVVTAFRLGFTGLLIFENDDVVYRNLPLYDLIQSLHWVQDNIGEFGGDRKKVTLMGHSGGGAAVASMAFSKSIDPKRKLFHRVIAMSATNHLPVNEMYFRFLTSEFARRAGCIPYLLTDNWSNNYVREIVECLRTKESHQLLAVQRKMEEEGLKVEGFLLTQPLFPSENTNDFMTNPPKVPMLCGATWYEMDHVGSDYAAVIADGLGYRNPMALTHKYKKDKLNGQLGFNHSSQTQSFFIGAREMVNRMTNEGAKCFLYSYRYWRHAKHTDDLSYIMGVHGFEKDENEEQLSLLYPQYFLNFIKTGVPDSGWEPFRENDENYYSINFDVKTGLRPQNALHFESGVIDYWTKEMAQYDIKVTSLKSKAKTIRRSEEFLDKSEENTIVDPLFAWFYNTVIFGMVLLGGVLLGRISAPRQVVVQMVPDERTPLFFK